MVKRMTPKKTLDNIETEILLRLKNALARAAARLSKEATEGTMKMPEFYILYCDGEGYEDESPFEDPLNPICLTSDFDLASRWFNSAEHHRYRAFTLNEGTDAIEDILKDTD